MSFLRKQESNVAKIPAFAGMTAIVPMISYDSFYELLKTPHLTHLFDPIKSKVQEAFEINPHGNLSQWLNALDEFPDIKPSEILLNGLSISVGKSSDDEADEKALLADLLERFGPWRKGPFTLFGIHIDTEWRSDMKWDRLKSSISSLQDKTVLDIGCGSGYHLWRMKGAGARLAMGVDPTMLFAMQFQVIQKYIGEPSVAVLPISAEDMPTDTNCFDTVFSMGVLYHRRDPLEHLALLKSFLKDDGEVILETLVIEGGLEDVLIPEERYAQMRNVWNIPSTLACESWLRRSGFKEIRLVDVTKTTSEEQRATDWAKSKSLKDFLDPEDSTKTIEGYPAPTRAIFIAKK